MFHLIHFNCRSLQISIMNVYCIISLCSNSSNDDLSYWYITRNTLSCSFLILLFKVMLWNIHTSGQYLNCQSINAFISILRFLLFSKLVKWDNAIRFIEALAKMEDTWLLELTFDSILTPNNFTMSCSHIKMLPMLAHICSYLCPAKVR